MLDIYQEAENVAKYIHEYLPGVYPIGAELHSGEKEYDYQNILASVFRVKKWVFRREVEAGMGRCDFIIRMPNSRIGIIIEFKHAQTGKEESFNNACNEALAQIEEKRYANYFAIKYSDYHVIYCGMAFYHQDCKVVFYDPQTKERKESGISGALVPASLEAKTTETASTNSSKETQAKEEPEAKEAKQNKKPRRKSQAKEEPEAKEAKPNKKSSRKIKAKEESEAQEPKTNKKSSRKAKAKEKPDKKSSSKKAPKSSTIEVSEEKQQIIKNLAEMGMTAKKISEIVELPEKIVKKYMK